MKYALHNYTYCTVLYILDFVSKESVQRLIGAPQWPNVVSHHILYSMFRILTELLHLLI